MANDFTLGDLRAMTTKANRIIAEENRRHVLLKQALPVFQKWANKPINKRIEADLNTLLKDIGATASYYVSGTKPYESKKIHLWSTLNGDGVGWDNKIYLSLGSKDTTCQPLVDHAMAWISGIIERVERTERVKKHFQEVCELKQTIDNCKETIKTRLAGTSFEYEMNHL